MSPPATAEHEILAAVAVIVEALTPRTKFVNTEKFKRVDAIDLDAKVIPTVPRTFVVEWLPKLAVEYNLTQGEPVFHNGQFRIAVSYNISTDASTGKRWDAMAQEDSADIIDALTPLSVAPALSSGRWLRAELGTREFDAVGGVGIVLLTFDIMYLNK